MPINKNISKTVEDINSALNSKNSFDIIHWEILIGKRKAALFFTDGFVKDDIIEKTLEFLYSSSDAEKTNDPEIFLKKFLPQANTSLSGKLNSVCNAIISLKAVLVVNGPNKTVIFDVRSYPRRQTGEPEKDRVIRGSKDGFVETLVNNTALIRRRIRSPHLIMKIFTVGSSSETDVAVCFTNYRTDKKLI